MASDDAKLKLLPRHLQRSQPAVSKSKRRVTVEDDNAADEESDRRSVFERLGPGGLQRHEKPKLDYGQSLKGRNKNDGEKSPDNLRLKFKSSKDRETKVRSQVVPLVVKKTDDAGSDEGSADESDNWSIDNLEDKKERELEQKRQEIQRALKALEDGDDAPIIELKKSDSSGSESSPERLHKKKKDKQGKKKEKKKHRKALSEKEMSLERWGKRKHGSEDEESSPHKKKKKKNKERKNVEEALPVPLMSLEVKKSSNSKMEPHMYEPDSPTSTHRTDSPDEKAKGKKKKKKAKMQAETAAQGKSKKLLSPLKKVLKLKKGPASVSSSKQSRSESRETSLKRKRSRSRSSSDSSTGSSSQSPVAKRKERNPSEEDHRHRGRVKSKSSERKKRRKQFGGQQHPSPRQPQQQQHHHHHHRSVSSSSSSSSSTTSSTARGVDRRQSKGQGNRSGGSEVQSGQRHKKSRSPAVASGSAAGRRFTKRRDVSSESWNRSKDRKEMGRGESPQQQHHQERGRGMGAAGDTGDRGRQRNRNVTHEEVKGHRNMSQPVGRHGNDSKDRSGSQQGPKDRPRRGQDASHDRNQKEGRDRDKDERKGRKDESRERPGPVGRHTMDDRGRRVMGGAGGIDTQMGDRGGRMLLRQGNSTDRDRRNIGGTDNSGRMGQFSRQDVDRGGGGRMGHNWEDRERDGRRDGGADWDSGRDMRAFGGHRDTGPGMGKRRDAGRDDRMLPYPGRGGPPRSGSQDRLATRGHNQRDEFGGPGRNRRAGSQEADTSRRDRDSSRGGRDDSRGVRGGKEEGGKSRGADRDARPTVEELNKDREGRERDSSRSDGQKGPISGRRDPSPSSTGSRIVSKLRGETTKEESPSVMRGESSLAAVFDQTETTRNSGSKKRPTKTFGGKKSPKKTSDDSKSVEDKNLSGGLSTRAGRNVLDKSKELSRPASRKVTPSRDSSKDGGKSGIKQEATSKERMSPASHRSVDSHHSVSKSSKRSSRSPPDGRQEAAQDSTSTTSGRKPVSKRSQSPVLPPSPAGGSSAVDTGRGRKREEIKEVDTGKERGNVKGRSETPSDVELKRSPQRTRRKSSDSIESLPAKLDGGDIAAAMLGDGLEDGQQDVFSDWSDDEDPFISIMEDGPRKHHVEDLDNAHEFGLGARGHGHREARNRRGSPSIGDQAPDNIRIMHHGMDQMDHASSNVGASSGHHDAPSFGRNRDFHHHHTGPGSRYFSGSDMTSGGSHADPGSGGPRSHMTQGRMDELLNKPALEKNIPDVKIVEDVQKEKPARERRRRNTGEEGYEEISSDENDLDEEGEKIPKRTIVSILDLDMSSLVQIANPLRSQSPSVSGRPAVFQRYKACSVFSQLGVSRHLLGEKLYGQVQQVCQKQLEQQTNSEPEQQVSEQKHSIPEVDASSKMLPKPAVNMTGSSEASVSPSLSSVAASEQFVKSEVVPPSGSTNLQTLENSEAVQTDQKQVIISDTISVSPPVVVTKQPAETVDTTKTFGAAGKLRPEFRLYADTPAGHVMEKAKALDRTSLINSFGLFRRALTARKDLEIRRQLCKIDTNYDQSAIYPTGLVDPDMFRMSLQLLRQKKSAMMATPVN